MSVRQQAGPARVRAAQRSSPAASQSSQSIRPPVVDDRSAGATRTPWGFVVVTKPVAHLPVDVAPVCETPWGDRIVTESTVVPPRFHDEPDLPPELAPKEVMLESIKSLESARREKIAAYEGATPNEEVRCARQVCTRQTSIEAFEQARNLRLQQAEEERRRLAETRVRLARSNSVTGVPSGPPTPVRRMSADGRLQAVVDPLRDDAHSGSPASEPLMAIIARAESTRRARLDDEAAQAKAAQERWQSEVMSRRIRAAAALDEARSRKEEAKRVETERIELARQTFDQRRAEAVQQGDEERATHSTDALQRTESAARTNLEEDERTLPEEELRSQQETAAGGASSDTASRSTSDENVSHAADPHSSESRDSGVARSSSPSPDDSMRRSSPDETSPAVSRAVSTEISKSGEHSSSPSPHTRRADSDTTAATPAETTKRSRLARLLGRTACCGATMPEPETVPPDVRPQTAERA